MSDSNYKFLLIFLQYVSIIISGILGIMGLYFDFRIKKTGKLNKWGKIASAVLMLTLITGIISKSIELKIQDKQDKIGEARAKADTEEKANLRDKLLRMESKINTINMVFTFTIPLEAKALSSHRATLKNNFGDWGNDQQFSAEQFAGLFEDKQWKQTIYELTYFQLTLTIYPKGTPVPKCVNSPPKLPFDGKDDRTGLYYSASSNVETFAYPRGEELFLVKSKGEVIRDKETGPANLSIMDFDGATIILYVETPTSYQPSGKPGKPGVFHVEQSAAMQYDNCNLMIYFDQDRMAKVRDFQYKLDKCSSLSYFIGHIQVRK